MDGRGVSSDSDGGGIVNVNCQYGASAYEKFSLVLVQNCTSAGQSSMYYTIESVAFPDRFLGMDGTGVNQFSDLGGGSVSCACV